MAQWVRGLAVQTRGPEFRSYTMPNAVAVTVTVNQVLLGNRNRDCWPCWHSFRFNERPCLKGIRDKG